MPSKILGLGKGFGRYGALGFLGLGKWIIKHWYLFVVIIVLLPAIITSIQTSIDTKNPLLPFAQLGERIINADTVLVDILEKPLNEIVLYNDDVNTLRENPDKLVGMAKPTDGIWLNFKYYISFFFNVIFKILGNLWLITLPFVFIFRVVHNLGDKSMPAKNAKNAFYIFILYLFIINSIFVVYKIIVGDANIDIQGIDRFKAYFMIGIELLPFHGIANLLVFLFQSIANTQITLSLLKNL